MKSVKRNANLSLRLTLGNGQTLPSFVSALAAHNGLRATTRFCKAFGIDAARLASGNKHALERLAGLSGTDVADLHDAGTWLSGSGYKHATERLERNQLRTIGHVCPQCLEDDRAASPDMRADAAARDRAPWGHAWVQVCITHNLRLIPLPALEGGKVFRHDLAAQLRALESPLLRDPAVPSAVDLYIHARFARTSSNSPFLDELELDDALFLARYLGAPHQYGQKAAAPADFGEGLAWTEQGLAIAARGKEAVVARLREIALIINPHGACEIGLRRIFRELADRVNGRKGRDMLVVREMLVAIGLEQNLFPFDQGEALGLQLPPRQTESVETARRRFGISDRVMRAILEELGVMPEGHSARPSNTILVNLSEFATLLDDLKDCLNLVQAARALGLLPQQLLKLSNRAGVIEPFFTRPSSDLKPLRYFRSCDLDAFMERVTCNCSRATNRTGLVDLWEAGLKVCRQPSDVIAAIAEGRIHRTFRVGKIRTLRDVLVDLDDVRTAMAEKIDDDLVSAEDCAHCISVNIQAMRMIMQSGILPAVQGTNPVNQRGQLAARQVDLAALHSKFVSLTTIRREWKTTPPSMAAALREAGVRPAFPVKLSGIGLYRRSDVAKAKPRIELVMTERLARHS